MTTVVQAGASAPAAGPDPITEPGIYEMTNEEYHSHRYALSSSGARKLLAPSSPAHFRYEQDNPQEPKKVWDIGNAAHRLVLGNGPTLQLVDYERWDTKVAKAEVAEAREAGAVPLKRGEYEQVHAMADVLRRHPVASLLFDPEHGTPERSLFWRDEPTGVMRRARLDWLPNPRSGRLIIPDYKTCRSANPEALERAIEEYGYHQQDDTYRSGCRALGIADDDAAFVFVCQEKTAPYVITVVEVNATARRIGAARNRRALEVFAECTRTGYWPGYSDDVVPLSLPGWAETRDTLEYL
ncbi:PD-(D/E)XK nuclease-like domain-containing protein [Streptomyces acidiscabies]|uniref:PD-(D/E)XK nuclease-like domain-containing protein n=1 Tax=Streptomyces acidiscabies TaxID=42234 RepID=A0AAP6ELG1_9ACTN|nr:PD-(D/E)XK nuclease-like domain-containing protein [Streptomyces acidiscabies]MBZ3909391.1 PD-(D/E)XK nuclease-like domain-containing protein [Streptomyces acidiscabies]MDX2966620.1 PD-(D/E)XK nuclease-like domain-containing protein [Streptomyces acidiscabies]MDX3796590.1 PD-(D/E)XK nuclease-like domain-containing protein [Streptomyces acidiscabies]